MHALQFPLEFSPSVCFGGGSCRGWCNNKRVFAWVRIHVAESMSQSSNLENSGSTTPWDNAYHQRTHSLLKASFIKLLLAVQWRHVSCVGAGRNWTPAVRVRVTGHRFRLIPATLIISIVLYPSKNKIELSSIRIVNNCFTIYFAERILSSSVTGSR